MLSALYRKLMCLPQIPFSGSAHFNNGSWATPSGTKVRRDMGHKDTM